MNHLKAFWSVALVAAIAVCVLVLPGAAKAQYENVPELSRNWNVRVGTYIFNSKAASDAGGRVGFSGVVERTVFNGDQYEVTVGIGYNGWDRIYSVPVTGGIIFHPGNLRLGAGVGYAFSKRVDGGSSNGSVVNLLVGWQLTHGKFPSSLDVRYYFVGGSSNELDGYGITYGVRF